MSYMRSLGSEDIDVEFVIVDNGSQDKTVSIIEKIFESMPRKESGKLVKLNKNLGTTKSRNIGLKQATGEFIVVCDSDTEYLDGKWQKIIIFLQKNSEVGIAAPQLVLEDGVVQNSAKKFPSILDKLFKLRRLFRFCEYIGDYYKDLPSDETKNVDTAISAFWIFDRKILQKVGYFDERFFYAPEDLDYCLRVWQSGYKVSYYPFLKIRHKTQRLSYSKPLGNIAFLHFLGLGYYFLKHKYIVRPKTVKYY